MTRLIDADALEKDLNTIWFADKGNCNDVFKCVHDAPTIEPTEHDGCVGCEYEDRDDDDYPCNECMCNYTSKWEKKQHCVEYDTGYCDGYKDGLAVGRKEAETNCAKCEHYRESENEKEYKIECDADTAHSDLISRAEAIDVLESVDWYHQNKNKDMVHGSNDFYTSWYKHDDIFKAIESVPSVPAVSRNEYEALKRKWIEAEQRSDYYDIDGDDIASGCVSTKEYLKTIPTVYLLEALGVGSVEELMEEPKRGEWIDDIAYYDEDGCPCIVTRCDQCGEANPKTNYCPNCGAKMGETK